jgi:hypothetical protein
MEFFVAQALCHPMHQYHFVIRWHGGQSDDEDGVPLPDDAAARDYAEEFIRELKEDDDSYNGPDLTMTVSDETGKELFTIRFK